MAKWTIEQEAAIRLRGANLLVSAAAGSGKTAVLVERITKMVLNGETSIDKMLIVTYTNAAASEMRSRIESALSAAIESQVGNSKQLNEQIKLLNRASIKTFHAFCLDVIRNHFHQIDCDPNFKLMGEPERVLLTGQAMEMAIEGAFEKAEPHFLSVVDAYSGNRDDEKLKGILFQIFDFIQSQPYPIKWLKEQQERYNQGLPIEWQNTLISLFKERLQSGIHLMEYAQDLCQRSEGPLPYLKTITTDIQLLERLLESSNTLESLAEAIRTAKFDRIASIKKDEKESMDETLIDEVKTLIRDKIIKKQVFEPIKAILDYKPMGEFHEEMTQLSQALEVLIELTIVYSDYYKALKNAKNLMDFNDLEHYAIEILENKDICDSYKQQFDAIYVDEYQDASGIQEHIINSISKGNNVFMVGDVKQSIYKFRLADPELFLSKYKSFVKLETLLNSNNMVLDEQINYEQVNAIIKTHNDLGIRVDLKRNFRTRPEVLETVNDLFKSIMSEKLGEITYDEDAMLNPGMHFEAIEQTIIEVNLISKKALVGDSGAMDENEMWSTYDSDSPEQDDEVNDAGDMLKTEEMEATAIAVKIKERLGQPVYDPKAQRVRPAQYRDFAILLRSSRSWTPTFEQVFMEQGIPLFADSQSGYFDTLEVKFILSLLKIVDNPYDDLALLTVLRSPIVGLNMDDIVQLKREGNGKYYYDKLLAIVTEEELESNLKMRLLGLYEQLEYLRKASKYLPLDELIWEALTHTGFYQYAAAMPAGRNRQANLKLLVDRASALKQSRILTLSHFVEFIEKMHSGSADFGVASLIGEADDVVRLMSIHKSKGLEFKIVIIGGLGRKFNFMDAQGDLILHKQLGIALSVVDTELRTKSKSLGQFAMREALKRETLSEEMRVLYVALTRPVDQLILFATLNDLESRERNWQRPQDILSLSTATGFIDWIMSTWLGHKKIKVNRMDGNTLAEGALKVEQVESERLYEVHSIVNGTNPELKKTIRESNAYQVIDHRFKFAHLVKTEAYKPLKVSVSELKSQSTNQSKVFESPQFIKAENVPTAMAIGTTMHALLEKIDYHMPLELNSIDAFIEAQIQKKLVDENYVAMINRSKIIDFLNSNLAKRIRASRRVNRETPFVLKHDSQLVQGIIDLYFMEGDKWVLIDFKTDFVTESSIHSVADNYRTQIEIYRKAIESLTGIEVGESYLYFIGIDRLYLI
ncbi:MAG: hypothetical protein BGO41_08505 [Clostridiales bacterium 38-18]|nr:MAG: hypothetical protein BGO41_08505 [Clostridiales bacterium 38-18]